MATSAAYIDLTEGAAPSTPAASKVRIYAKSDGSVYQKDDAGTETGLAGAGGSVATDAIWDTAGDLAVGSGANTAAKLAIGATNGMALRRVSGAVAWDLPPGHEYDYVQITSSANLTATTEAGANTVVTATATAFDGSTVIYVEFFSPSLQTPGGSNAFVGVALYDDTGGGAASIGILAVSPLVPTGSARAGGTFRRRLTPSAATHTYSIRAYANATGGVVEAGAGGSGNRMPTYIRLVKA
jgi:hypothetical protein